MPSLQSSALASLIVAAPLAPARADNSVSVLEDTQGLSVGRFPAMDPVDCVVPCCAHNPDGSLNHEKSTDALEWSQTCGPR